MIEYKNILLYNIDNYNIMFDYGCRTSINKHNII